MANDKTFCLKWNDFQQNIFSTFKNLRLDLDFLDVTIFCKGRQMKAHKVLVKVDDLDHYSPGVVLPGDTVCLQQHLQEYPEGDPGPTPCHRPLGH